MTSPVRSQLDLSPNPKVKEYTVDTAQVATQYFVAAQGTTDTTCKVAATTDIPLGIFMSSAVAGGRCEICISPDAIVQVKVGTGGATAMSPAIIAAGTTGLTNAPAPGGGTIAHWVVGHFTQSGVAGDIVGFQFSRYAIVAAT